MSSVTEHLGARATGAAADREGPGALRAAGLFAGRDFTIALSYKTAFLMSVASVLMSLITFRFIAKLVGGVRGIPTGYFSFVVIGLVMSQILDGALSAPSGQVRQEQVQGTLEVLATTPLSAASLSAGWIAYPVLNGTLISLVMLLMAGPLGLRFATPDWPLALLAIVLATLSFAGLGILICALVLVIQQGAALTRWITAGMGLLSGVFFPVALFPRPIRIMALASPLTHAVSALRGALLSGRSAYEMRGDLAALAIFAAVLLPLSVWTVSLALRRARARSTISTY